MNPVSTLPHASTQRTPGFDVAYRNSSHGGNSAGPVAWRQPRTSSHPTSLLVMVMVLLGIVIAIEVMALALVARGQVAQAQVRERLRAANPLQARQCGRGISMDDCLSRISLATPGR